MIGRKRAYALLLCACVALGLFFPSIYPALAAGHFCCGEGCAVCEAMAKTEALIRAFSLFALALAVCPMAAGFPAAAGALPEKQRAWDNTPVGQKVRMND